MTKVRLTDRWISAARPPATGRTSVVDSLCPGLHLRITTAGTKTFSVMVRYGGRLRRQTLGEYPIMTLKGAREETLRIQRAAAGQDKIVEPPPSKRASDESAVRFGAMVDSYVALHLKPNTKSWKNVQSTLRQDAVLDLTDRAAASISRTEVVAVLDSLVERGKPHAAANLLKAIRAMFNWAIDRGMVTDNPFSAIRMPVRPTARERTLDDNEIAAILGACDQVPAPFGDMIRLLLHTGARRNEVAQMRWSELHENVWTLPAARSKSGRANALPLPPAAMATVTKQPRYSDDGFVFSTTGGVKASSDFSKRKHLLDVASDTSGWRLHDLRRTVRSKLAQLGVPREIARRVVGHSVDQLDAIYDRHDYIAEKAAALIKLADHIAQLPIAKSPSP